MLGFPWQSNGYNLPSNECRGCRFDSLSGSKDPTCLTTPPPKKEHKQKKQYFNKFSKDMQKILKKKIQTMDWYEFFSHINSGNSNHTPMRWLLLGSLFSG